MVQYSVLDLVPVPEGSTPGQALAASRELAIACDRLGYTRYWLAEHHNMVGIASAATSVVIGYLAGATKRIRVGSGGIMLPNHSPLVIAEQFGTLDALYPGRIDLGVGRAPGTDHRTMMALRRDPSSADRFPQDVLELQALLAPAGENQVIRAVPGAGSEVPIWVLGTSLFGAQLAAMLGMPYAFAAHFAPEQLTDAIDIYRARFEPSAQLAKPHLMVCVNVVVADTDAEAKRLFTSVQQSFTNLIRGTRGQMRPPIDDIETYWKPHEKMQAQRMLACAIVGSPETVKAGLDAFVARTGADEIMVTTAVYDQAARVASYRKLAEIVGLDREGLAAVAE